MLDNVQTYRLREANTPTNLEKENKNKNKKLGTTTTTLNSPLLEELQELESYRWLIGARHSGYEIKL